MLSRVRKGRKRKEEINLHRQHREFACEIQDQDRESYNDIVYGNFLFVEMVDHWRLCVNQDRIQYEIFSVLFSFGNKYQSAKMRMTYQY